MDEFAGNSIFWIEVDKIKPNPFQPRKEFNEDRLRDLADSIRQYGVLQPLVVTRKEVEKEDGGLVAEYELIAGERRLRASKIAGIKVVPAIIRTGEETDKLKLEMAIIENLQREDLNPVDRAQAFHRLINEFDLKHIDVAKRVGKSREYVSNSVRILALPQEILDAIISHQITEGHTRPILMLADRPGEQITLFKEILAKKLTVRDAEQIARRIAYDRVRKKEVIVEPSIIEIEEHLSEKYGTRVKVEKREKGGRVVIDYFTPEDLHKILDMMDRDKEGNRFTDPAGNVSSENSDVPIAIEGSAVEESFHGGNNEEKEEDDQLYFIKNFSI